MSQRLHNDFNNIQTDQELLSLYRQSNEFTRNRVAQIHADYTIGMEERKARLTDSQVHLAEHPAALAERIDTAKAIERAEQQRLRDQTFQILERNVLSLPPHQRRANADAYNPSQEQQRFALAHNQVTRTKALADQKGRQRAAEKLKLHEIRNDRPANFRHHAQQGRSATPRQPSSRSGGGRTQQFSRAAGGGGRGE